MIGIVIPWLLWDAALSYTKMAIREDRGRREGLMVGIWVLPRITTDVTCITYLKQGDTAYRGQRSCSPNTANFPT